MVMPGWKRQVTLTVPALARTVSPLAPAFRSTSKLWSAAVAVCSNRSLFTQWTVSPTWASMVPGWKAMSAMATVIVRGLAAGAGLLQPPRTSAPRRPANRTPRRDAAPTSVQFMGQVLGVRLMFAEQLQARLQQRLQFAVVGRGDQGLGQGAVDGLVVGDLVGDIGLVEGGALQLVQLGALGRRLFLQGGGGGIGFGCDAQLLHQGQGLVVHGGVVARHFLGEGARLGVLGLGQGLLACRGIGRAGGVGDVSELRIGRAGCG